MTEELRFYEDSKTQVVIGQRCCIGRRHKYSAISYVVSDSTEKFVDLWPEDVGIFLGNIMREIGYSFVYDEIALFPKQGMVACSEGVLEPVNE